MVGCFFVSKNKYQEFGFRHKKKLDKSLTYVILYGELRKEVRLDIDVKALRKSLKLTQKELAKKLHVEIITVSRWEHEKARPNQASVRKLRRLLNKKEVNSESKRP